MATIKSHGLSTIEIPLVIDTKNTLHLAIDKIESILENSGKIDTEALLGDLVLGISGWISIKTSLIIVNKFPFSTTFAYKDISKQKTPC